MAVTWTKDQQSVIDARGSNLLVSAAAGSGKTAVLVERIIQRITAKEHPVDIDRLLVVTFTKAAAAEMRGRITEAINRKCEEEPDNERMKRQQVLIHNAKITTIDSFCSFVVRNHFGEIDLDPDFRMADEGELRLLEQDVLDEVFEAYYVQAMEEAGDASGQECDGKENASEFIRLIDSCSGSKNDQEVRDMVSRISRMSENSPWPEEWIAGLAGNYQADSIEEFMQTDIINEVVACVRIRLQEATEALAQLREQAAAACGLDNYVRTLDSDLEGLQAAQDIDSADTAEAAQGLYEFFAGFQMERLKPADRKAPTDIRDLVKEERSRIKKELEELKKDYFSGGFAELYEQTQRIRPMAEQLITLTLHYRRVLHQRKREKRLVSFSDIEHFALHILVDQDTKELRPAAEEFRKQYVEIMIDEYQDSNQVQEEIMKAISGGSCGVHNLFMVGDVKQSIYRFRQARPELFMEKYQTYQTSEHAANRRITLSKNFRSRRQVLDFTNDIFRKIMQPDIGGVAYDEDAALYEGADYPEAEDMDVEVLLYDRSAESEPEEPATDSAAASDSPESRASQKQLSEEKASRIEVRMIAQRIHALMEHGQVTDKATGALRPVSYGDMVILVRSLKGREADFTEVLEDAGIPVHIASSVGYFSALEVQVILAFLQILDNPLQDIPLTTVLRSPIAGCTDEELAQLRVRDRKKQEAKEQTDDKAKKKHRIRSFAEAAWEAMEEAQEGKLREFCDLYHRMRKLVPDLPIHELIQRILRETGYGDYAAALPAGAQRAANLNMLVEKAVDYEKGSYKGLFHFVRYIEELRKYEVDFGEAEPGREQRNAVSIMTIHKSKGLEFPIVFLANIGSDFNRREEGQGMLLHMDMGMGLDERCMAPKRRIRCLIRSEIADRIHKENIGEQLRVLYVALTRAKEKLILAGSVKDYGKLQQKLIANVRPDCALSYAQRIGAKSYLEWILPAMNSWPGRYEAAVYGPEELVLKEAGIRAEETLEHTELYQKIQAADDAQIEAMKKNFAFVYPYAHEAGRKSKYSVSELKRASMLENYDRSQNEAEQPDFIKQEKEAWIPSFVRSMLPSELSAKSPAQDASRGAMRGTAVHRVMECLDFTVLEGRTGHPDGKSARELANRELARMQKQGLLDPDMAALVPPSMLADFLQDPVALRMAQADARGAFFREKPFVMEAEGVLIQGIIDVFWMEEDKLVLLDYKTDAVHAAQELTERYHRQLELYAEALSRLYPAPDGSRRKVEQLIYSFRLGACIVNTEEM